MKVQMQKNKILVNGGAGFVGSHLCKELLKKDNYVICVDNFFTEKVILLIYCPIQILN